MKFVWNEDLRLKTDGDTARKIEVFTSERCEGSHEFAAQEYERTLNRRKNYWNSNNKPSPTGNKIFCSKLQTFQKKNWATNFFPEVDKWKLINYHYKGSWNCHIKSFQISFSNGNLNFRTFWGVCTTILKSSLEFIVIKSKSMTKINDLKNLKNSQISESRRRLK